MMMPGVRTIDWNDPTEAIPAFLTIVMMPLTVSITDGIAFGFVSYAALKLVTGRTREAHWLVYLFAALFVARYVWLAR
jgi:AGZA family xanthine/uracil permease-like MFS transporter